MKLEGRGGLQLGIRAAAGSPLGRAAAAGAAALLLIVVLAAIGAAGVSTGSASCEPAPSEFDAGDVSGLPAEARKFAAFYVGAAERERLGQRGPAILAAIHSVETGFGELNGVTSSAGAIGHMQFLPSSWEAYGVDANGDGERDAYDAEDAIYSAANLLHASGAPGDWYGAIFAYNNADWYVQDVLAAARRFGDVGEGADATTTTCEGESVAAGPADLTKAVRVYEPARDVMIPARYMAPGFAPDPIDARIWPNVRWVLETYDLAITAGKETGHLSHGDGSAIDAVPAGDIGSQAAWDQSALRLAEDLGWSRDCGYSGARPVCDLVPAIEWIGYEGFASHGSPATCSGTCPAHIHISWVSSAHGTPHLTTPEWMMVFPVPEPGSTTTEETTPALTAASEAEALVVGDSLTVGAAPYLRERLGSQVEIDARVGRPSPEGLAVLRRRLAPSHEIVAFDLGGNDGPSQAGVLADNLAAARRESGDRCLVVSTVHVPGGSALNRVIERFAREASNVVLYDWHAIADGHPELLQPDGMHATSEGYRRRADAAIEAMLAC